MKNRVLFILMACTLMPCTFSARLAASPLDLMIGPRGIGMGGAYVAISDDPSAAYWNPAGLALVNKVAVTESNLLYQDVSGLNVNYASLCVPVEKVGTVCGSWLLTSVTLDEGWNYATNAPFSTSSANEQTFSLGIGTLLLSNFWILKQTCIGFNINRYTYSTTIDKSAGVGLDLGLLTRLPYGFSLGLMGRNLGADVGGEPIDPQARLGMAFTHTFLGIHTITAALDGLYIMNRDYNLKGAIAQNNGQVLFGLEYALSLNGFEIAVRGGANGLARTSLDSYGYTAGAGFKYKGQTVEYAFQGRTQTDESIGNEHHLSVIFDLSPGIKWLRVTRDVTPPVMTLRGDSVINLSTRDSAFSDPGLTAVDNISGDLTNKVIVNDTLNQAVPGVYYITYSVYDEAGNMASKKRKIIVKAPDTTPPVITLLGDSLMTLAVGELYSETGVRVTDNVDTTFPNLTKIGTVDISKPGDNFITYAVSDKAGNVATKQRKIIVVPERFKRFGIPLQRPLATMKKTFTHFDVEGKSADLSKVVDLKLDWSQQDSSLHDFSFDMTGKRNKTIPLSLLDKIRQSFSTSAPKMTIVNSGLAGIDGEYYVTDKDGNFALVKTDGAMAVIFKP